MSRKRGYRFKDEHLQIFEVAFAYWKDYYGLKDWKIHGFAVMDIGKLRAEVIADCTARQVKVNINTFWSQEPTEESIWDCAFHEVWEVVIAPLVSCATSRFVAEWEVGESSHTIIQILFNTHYAEWKKANMKHPGKIVIPKEKKR